MPQRNGRDTRAQLNLLKVGALAKYNWILSRFNRSLPMGELWGCKRSHQVHLIELQAKRWDAGALPYCFDPAVTAVAMYFE
jgi:hypothetical protein